MAAALILAGGRGVRLGSGRPKALVSVYGRPMLDWSVDALRAVDEVQEILVALPEGHLHLAPEGTVAVAGGASRSESTRNALARAGETDLVIVHDAARPLATPGLFARTLERLHACSADAVVAAVPVSDTIRQTSNGALDVTSTLERTRLWAVQTPQVFRRAALERALKCADSATLATASDDASLVEKAGGTVEIVPGEASNVKVTALTELHVAELLLAERDASQSHHGPHYRPRSLA